MLSLRARWICNGAALLRVAFGSDAPQLVVLVNEGSEGTFAEAAGVVTKPVNDAEVHALVDDLVPIERA